MVSKTLSALPTALVSHVTRRWWVRRVAAWLAVGGLLGALPAFDSPARVPIHPALALTAGAPWLDRFNLWRSTVGLPAVAANAVWSDGDTQHSVYMVKNDAVAHYETPGVPYYSAAGDTAARNSNIYVSSSTSTTDEQAIDWWIQAPFHALGMLDPRLTTTGFGSYREVKSGWQLGAALDTIHGNSFAGGRYPVYFPGNGSSEPLRTFSGGEFPDPLQACPGYTVPTGLPVFVQVGANTATTAGPIHSFLGNGVPLEHCVIDSNNPAVGSYLTGRGGVIVVPRQPLQNGVTYAVSLTVNGAPYSWSFTVGPFSPPLACRSVTASAAPLSAAAAGGNVTVTGAALGCPTPQYEFWVLNPGSSTWQVAQPYSSSATFNWSTGGRQPGGYRLAVWAKDASSTANYEAFSSGLNYTLTTGACALAGIATSQSSAAVGTSVTITGSAAGCPTPTFEFWVQSPGSAAWQVAQPYSASSTLNWSTAGKAAGAYTFVAWARNAGSTANYEAFSSGIADSLSSGACTSAGLSASPAGRAAAGTTVTVVGRALGCSSPTYELWVLGPGSSTWQLAQAYSASATFNWSTAGKAAGSYSLVVWTRNAASAANYEAFSTGLPYTLG